MAELYLGRKFTTIFLSRAVPRQTQKARELLVWCRRFAGLGIGPEYPGGGAGNLSFRRGGGLVITAGGVPLGRLEPSQLVEVTGCDPAKGEVCVRGALEPSSETMLHWAIYAARREVQAVFHGHDSAVLAAVRELGLPVTAAEHPYGTVALVEEVLRALDGHDYLVMRGHGFLALGRSMARAGRLTLTMHRAARENNPAAIRPPGCLSDGCDYAQRTSFLDSL